MRRLRGRGTLVLFAVGGGLLYLVGILAITLVFDEGLPLIGWIGFGVVTAIVLGLGAGMAFFLVRSSRAAGSEPPARRPAPRAGGAHCVLVVLDEGCPGEALGTQLAGTLPHVETELLVVAPTLVSAVRYLDSDSDRARDAARARLDETLAALAATGIPARRQIGSESPLQAIADALAVFPADEIVVATPPPQRTNWLERGVVDRARELYEIPVSHLVVAPPPVDAGRR